MNKCRYSKSLRYKVQLLLKEKHKQLFDSTLKEFITNLKEYSFDRDHWWIILIIVILVFVFGTLFGSMNLDFLNLINLDLKTAQTLVDQRAANIAAIASITLVVVGFMLNNIAVKESITYNLLFKYSRLYPIIFLTLSTIGCFFVLSSIRDELNSSYFKNAVLAGTYLSVFILFLIGFLFKKIIEFTNEKEIRRMLHQELENECKRNLKLILMYKYSKDIFQKEMTDRGLTEYVWYGSIDYANFNIDETESANQGNKRINKEMYLYDVNLRRLRKFIIRKQSDKIPINFRSLTLGKRIIKEDREKFILKKDVTFSSKDKFRLKQSFVTRKVKDTKKDNGSLRNYFDIKLEDLVNKSDYKNVDALLNSYFTIYELQINNQ